MNLQGTIVLTLVSVFERLSYYGVRAILVLYAVDTEGLHADRAASLQYFAVVAFLFMVLPIPFGLLTDRILGQRKSVKIGGAISLTGYCLLYMLSNISATIAAIALIIIGTSLSKPSTTILVGRQFPKTEKKRTLAYIIYFMGINLGAFLGIFLIGYTGEIHGWKSGFLLAGLSNIIYLAVFHLFIDRVLEREVDLDSPNIASKTTTIHTFGLLFLTVLVLNATLVTGIDITHDSIADNIVESASRSQRDTSELYSIMIHLSDYLPIPLGILMFLFWRLNGIGSTIKIFIICICLVTTAAAWMSTISIMRLHENLEIVLIPIVMLGCVNAILHPIVASYLTRISPIGYSNTIYASFHFLAMMIGNLLIMAQGIFGNLYTITILTSMLTLSLVIFQDKVRALAKGID